MSPRQPPPNHPTMHRVSLYPVPKSSTTSSSSASSSSSPSSASTPSVNAIGFLAAEHRQSSSGMVPSLTMAAASELPMSLQPHAAGTSSGGLRAAGAASSSSSSLSASFTNEPATKPTKVAKTLACPFCRTRKLKCIVDGDDQQCRQCKRRNIVCEMPLPAVEASSAMTTMGSTGPIRPKRRRPSAKKDLVQAIGYAGSGSETAASSSSSASGSGTRSYASYAGPPAAAGEMTFGRSSDGHETKLEFISNSQVVDTGDSRIMSDPNSIWLPADASRGYIPHSNFVSSGSSGTSLVTLPATVPNWGRDWWDRCLAAFGPRPQSVRIVEVLLKQFVAKHSSLMSILHGPTFFEVIKAPDRRPNLHPALVFAALAAAVCDLNTHRAEPYTADMAAAEDNARRMATKLRGISNEYLDAALLSNEACSIALAQSASILALTETNATGRRRLMALIEAIVHNLRLPSIAIHPPGEVELAHAGEPEFYQLPPSQGSREADLKFESIVRICKTSIAHVCRAILACPDREPAGIVLPDFVLELRAFNYWEPAVVPQVHRETYYGSYYFSRAASVLSKILARMLRMPLSTSPTDPDAQRVLKDLNSLEKAVQWLRIQPDDMSADIFPRPAQDLFVKVFVFCRMSLWRKTKLFRTPGDEHIEAPSGLISSIDWWADDFVVLLQELEVDSQNHFATGDKLTCTDRQVETAIRMVRLGTQILRAIGYPQFRLRQIIRNALTTVQVQVNLRPGSQTDESLPLADLSELARSELDSCTLALSGKRVATPLQLFPGNLLDGGPPTVSTSELWAQMNALAPQEHMAFCTGQDTSSTQWYPSSDDGSLPMHSMTAVAAAAGLPMFATDYVPGTDSSMLPASYTVQTPSRSGAMFPQSFSSSSRNPMACPESTINRGPPSFSYGNTANLSSSSSGSNVTTSRQQPSNSSSSTNQGTSNSSLGSWPPL